MKLPKIFGYVKNGSKSLRDVVGVGVWGKLNGKEYKRCGVKV